MEAAGEEARRLGYAVELVGCRTGRSADKLQGRSRRPWKGSGPFWRRGSPPATGFTLACLSTDGLDGHSALAGALADEETLLRAAAAGLDPDQALAAYDSATFFEALGDGLRLGPTGTNVADLAIALVEDPERPEQRRAFLFGGETTVRVALPQAASPDRAAGTPTWRSWPPGSWRPAGGKGGPDP